WRPPLRPQRVPQPTPPPELAPPATLYTAARPRTVVTPGELTATGPEQLMMPHSAGPVVQGDAAALHGDVVPGHGPGHGPDDGHGPGDGPDVPREGQKLALPP